MLKKLAIIGLVTGFGQLFSVFVLRYLLQKGDSLQIALIGQADSLYQFLINLIAFGLQSDAMRNIALQNEWKKKYVLTQEARFTLSLFIMLFSVFFIAEPVFIMLLIAPLLALSGDYALYAAGYPLAGAVAALFRVVIPFMITGIGAYLNYEDLMYLFIFSLILVYLITDVAISKFLNVPFMVRPSFLSLRLYIKNISLGIVTVALYFIGFGLLIVIPYFYKAEHIAPVVAGLKIYMIFRGGLRVIHQSFISKMLDESVCIKLDELSSIFALIYTGSVFIFPKTFILLFFGNEYLSHSLFFKLLSCAAFIYSFYLSAATKAMLLKKDISYTFITVTAALISIVFCIVLSYNFNAPTSIGVSILCGEIAWLIGLVIINSGWVDCQKRMIYTGKNGLLLIIPFIAVRLLGSAIPVYVTSFIIMTAVLFFLRFKNFKTTE
jgi:hypothetical protein